jgi:hypothetical protein
MNVIHDNQTHNTQSHDNPIHGNQKRGIYKPNTNQTQWISMLQRIGLK